MGQLQILGFRGNGRRFEIDFALEREVKKVVRQKNTSNEGRDDEVSHEIAQKVNFLFENCRKSNGERYTFREVSELSGGAIDSTWLWRLSKGQSSRPGLTTLKAITDFFGIDPSYWFNDLDEGLKAKIKIENSSTTAQQIALRAIELSPEAQQIILNLIDSFNKQIIVPNPNSDPSVIDPVATELDSRSKGNGSPTAKKAESPASD